MRVFLTSICLLHSKDTMGSHLVAGSILSEGSVHGCKCACSVFARFGTERFGMAHAGREEPHGQPAPPIPEQELFRRHAIGKPARCRAGGDPAAAPGMRATPPRSGRDMRIIITPTAARADSPAAVWWWICGCRLRREFHCAALDRHRLTRMWVYMRIMPQNYRL